jgi:hypothetical protein
VDRSRSTASERRNAISVVVRLEYRGRSILFTGDTVGRRLDDADDACSDAEKIMVDRHMTSRSPYAPLERWTWITCGLTHGLASSHLFRTDFGDDEPGTFEWKVGRVPGCSDPSGDTSDLFARC